jgi:hypothetical protein
MVSAAVAITIAITLTFVGAIPIKDHTGKGNVNGL